MYKKVLTNLDFSKREEEILELWEDLHLNEKLQTLNEGRKQFTIYDGPPTANGKPHIGHVLTRSIKDIFPRFYRMKGHHVEFIEGWDTHGLPVELEVEKLLGIDGKGEIEHYGLEPFVQKCKESVWKYKDEWAQMSKRVGYTADSDHPYVTYENTYIETEWWILKQLWEKDLLYKGYKIVPYCPRCGTALSSHEVAQGYKDVEDTSAYVRFKVDGEEDTYFAAWTTTPWTLPSNVALCVNPSADYAKIKVVETCCDHHSTDSHLDKHTLDEHNSVVYYYLAKDLVTPLFGEDATIVHTLTGKDLVGKTYTPLFDYAKSMVETTDKRSYVVVSDDYVTLTDGTGIVHIAPAFGEDDGRIGQRENLMFIQFVKDDGTMPAEVYDFTGQFCKDADRGIIQKLIEEGLLIKTKKIEHSYPFCWRCDTPLIYYARHSWFIKMTAVKEDLLKNNQSVNWIPDNIKNGRFGNFLENVVDWGLSRERYWGTPLPVWECVDCNHRHLIGSIEELKKMATKPIDEIELHRPYIDQVHLHCPCCESEMTRVSEVIDCWFDSGAMPFAQYHYPFGNQSRYDKHFPANFISEALDQTRGWFYSLMAISTALGLKAPYQNVIVLGLVMDKDGVKMSKHKGNVVNPWDALNKYGADAIRWYFYTNSQPWLPSRYSDLLVREGQNKFLGTLWNTYAFYIMYAEIDQFDPTKYTLNKADMPLVDRWLMSKLHRLVKSVTEDLMAYDIFTSGRKLNEFVDDLSNWYVRRNRKRYWQEKMEADKVSAYMTLYTALHTLIHLAAPYIPFLTEQIYQNIVCSVNPKAPKSIHLTSYPEADETWINDELETKMSLVRKIVTMGRACRNNSNIKNRQPLSRIIVQTEQVLDDDCKAIILEELNVKSFEVAVDLSHLQNYKFKPQLKLLGKKLGRLLPIVSKQLATLDGKATMKHLKERGFIEVEVEGNLISLVEEELIIETLQQENFALEQDQTLLVALDLQLDETLIKEGYVRELISKIQTMRKESDFEVTDRIIVRYDGSKPLLDVFSQFNTLIASETLAVSLIHDKEVNTRGKSWEINKEPCWLEVEVQHV